MNQKYFFEMGSFPNLSEEEISAVFPKFEKEKILLQHILRGYFPTPSSGTPLEERPKAEIQEIFDTLGGSLRCGVIIGTFQNLDALMIAIVKILAEKHSLYAKKLCFGVSHFSDVELRQHNSFLKKSLLSIKEEAQKKGISVRFVNRDFRSLDSGTYHKEALGKDENSEFCIFETRNELILGETLAAQNVEEFAKRDFGKPVRDMNVGMLPPKLALMMVNFSRDEKGLLPKSIWDPFCGTGSILIEAEKIGIRTFGSDISSEMVEASRENMSFFFPEYDLNHIFHHDATEKLSKKINAEVIVSEGYLGPIQHNSLSREEYTKISESVFSLYEGFFQILKKNFSGKKIILAVPFWRGSTGSFLYLENILETAQEFGYTSQALQHGNKRGGLEFLRKNQVVGREIFRFVPKDL